MKSSYSIERDCISFNFFLRFAETSSRYVWFSCFSMPNSLYFSWSCAILYACLAFCCFSYSPLSYTRFTVNTWLRVFWCRIYFWWRLLRRWVRCGKGCCSCIVIKLSDNWANDEMIRVWPWTIVLRGGAATLAHALARWDRLLLPSLGTLPRWIFSNFPQNSPWTRDVGKHRCDWWCKMWILGKFLCKKMSFVWFAVRWSSSIVGKSYIPKDLRPKLVHFVNVSSKYFGNRHPCQLSPTYRF